MNEWAFEALSLTARSPTWLVCRWLEELLSASQGEAGSCPLGRGLGQQRSLDFEQWGSLGASSCGRGRSDSHCERLRSAEGCGVQEWEGGRSGLGGCWPPCPSTHSFVLHRALPSNPVRRPAGFPPLPQLTGEGLREGEQREEIIPEFPDGPVAQGLSLATA